VGFDDSAWPSGGQLLYIESATLSSSSGFVKTTALPKNGSIPFATTYFRRHFTWNGPATGVVLRATAMIDDGAVIYLNGQEAARVRMPTGAITFTTLTSVGAIGSGNEAIEETIVLPAELLVQGDNVIAVEVHQMASDSSDVVWGMKLDAEINYSPTTVENLLPVGASWKYMASSTSYHGTYQAVDFDDSAWPSGGQLLHYESGTVSSASGFAKTTQLPINGSYPFATYYFRTHFNWNGSTSGLELRATTMIDDAALIYLNGQEAARVRLPAGTVAYGTYGSGAIGPDTEAVEETIVLPANLLVQGDNVLAVEVHQVNSTSTDMVWGMKLDAVKSGAAAASLVVINEVLARNESLPNPDASLAGWVELYNPGTSDADIGDISLGYSASVPRAWVVPAGTVVPAGGYLVIQCDPALPPSATNTGFAPGTTGGSLHLFHSLALGGGLRDSVTWGNQLPDLSIGRTPNGSGAFALNIPTRLAINTAAATGSLQSVRINEWLASPASGPDWFELFNTGSVPVLVGGNYLTDNLSNKTKQLVAPLSFIGGTGNSRWLAFIADNTTALPGHVNFALSASGEALGLFTAAGVQIDAVAFGTQTSGVSEGSYPDGSDTILAMPPTQGTANIQPNPDTDGDGMPDAWETAHGLLSGDPGDAGLDPDGDGMTNLAEFVAGTDPQDRGSRMVAAIEAGDGTMLVRFLAQPDRSYTVQFSPSLQPGSWQKLADVSPRAAAEEVTVSDPAASGQPARFYRVITPAQP